MKRKITMVRVEPKMVQVEWMQATDADVWETHTLKSIEHPTPSLKKAMQGMLGTALRLLELEKAYGANCNVRAIQYDTIGDELAFSIHVVKQLGEGNGGRLVLIKTPMAMSIAAAVVRCTENDVKLAESVQEEAEAYLDGERANDDLFPTGKTTNGSIGSASADETAKGKASADKLPPPKASGPKDAAKKPLTAKGSTFKAPVKKATAPAAPASALPKATSAPASPKAQEKE
jgi:hypothetical protein